MVKYNNSKTDRYPNKYPGIDGSFIPLDKIMKHVFHNYPEIPWQERHVTLECSKEDYEYLNNKNLKIIKYVD